MIEFIKSLPPENVSVNNYSRGVAVGSPNSVRCYRSSPDRVTLQIRGSTRYATVSLPFDVARELSAALAKQGVK